MPEAITKYAINSTLGTSDFKSLDKIIIGEKRFAASDATLTIVEGSIDVNGYNLSTEYDIGNTFEPQIDGVVRMKVTVSGVNAGEQGHLAVYLYENNTKFKTLISTAKDPGTAEIDVPIIKNNKYNFKFYYNQNYSMSTRGHASVKICGQVVDANYFKYE